MIKQKSMSDFQSAIGSTITNSAELLVLDLTNDGDGLDMNPEEGYMESQDEVGSNMLDKLYKRALSKDYNLDEMMVSAADFM